MSSKRTIRCPTCKKEGEWFEGNFGPFCSKRCKLVDLSKWLGEENRISEPLRPDHFLWMEENEKEAEPKNRTRDLTESED